MPLVTINDFLGSLCTLKNAAPFNKTFLFFRLNFSEINSDESKYTIGFYNKDQNSSRQLIRLYPYFDTSNEMKTLIRIIIDSDGHGDMEKVRVRCYQEVYETMGKPSFILFNDLFEKLYKVLRIKAK